MNYQDIKRITDFVFPKHQATISFCDILVVLGSAKAVEYKMPDAVSLYHQGKASKLLLTGANKTVCGRPEYEAMQGYAIEHGVPESDIIIEPKARDTIENARLSFQLIHACVPAVSNIGLLTTAFHIKRAEHLFKAFLSENQSLHCFYVNDKSTRRDNWWLTDAARKRVLHSYKTLQGFHAN